MLWQLINVMSFVTIDLLFYDRPIDIHYLVGRLCYLHLDMNLDTHVSTHPICIDLLKYVHMYVGVYDICVEMQIF